MLSSGATPALLSRFAPRAPARSAVSVVSAHQPRGSIGLEAVLEMVKRTAGTAVVDADAPLMEVGLDSLGAVELRNLLEQASGSEALPSNLFEEHPTARGLAILLERDAASNAPPAARAVVGLEAVLEMRAA